MSLRITHIGKAIAPGIALRLALQLVQRQAVKRSDQGLTLIEGLVAIIVVTITVVSITPPIFWATGSRVQTRRAEQALQLAQGEIDRVRALVERDKFDLTNLPPDAGTEEEVRAGIAAPNSAQENKVVTANPSCSSKTNVSIPDAQNKYIQVDVDLDQNGNCDADFLVQTFRSRGLDANGNAIAAGQKPAGFVMGVRVYSFVARENLNANKGEKEQVSLKGTTGLGNQLQRPLAVLYSTIVPSNASTNMDLYRALCKPTNTDLQGSRKC
ncbi:MAG: type II secretion system GspH family protein [Myxacorys chilensis ATA2-1-KO14]|jgi:type II secretory pathway pseudopilin PulG|nr:type II secretion system GspH family protein [Myxacorys chilensis ATA2-1-KO14]